MVKKMIGVEIEPGVVAHVSLDISQESFNALRDLARAVRDMTDEDLDEVRVYADYLKSKHKRKVGRPRKGNMREAKNAGT